MKKGFFISIKLDNANFAFGITFNNQVIVYDFYSPNESVFLDTVAKSNILFIVGFHDSFLRSVHINKLEKIQIDDREIKLLPPKFWQSIGDYQNCILLYQDGREEKTTPERCIGLERVASWDDNHIIDRILANRGGKETFNEKHLKVRLK